MGERRHRIHISSGLRLYLAVLAAALAVFGLLYWLVGGRRGEEAAPSSSQQQEEEGVLLAQGAPQNEKYLRETLFIGDSRTLGLATYGYVEPEQVFAQDGMNHHSALTEKFVDLGDGKPLTIAQAVKKRAPKRMVVSYGINGISFMGEEAFMADYEALVDALMRSAPGAAVIIQSIYPVSAQQARQVAGMENETIDSYNRLLLGLAEKKGIYFLNTAEKLKDSTGALDEKYDAGDGLHMNTTAYAAILEYLSTHPVPDKR